MRITRRHLLRNAAGASAGLALPWGARAPSANAAGTQLKKYVQKVPLPGAGIVVATGSSIAFTQSRDRKGNCILTYRRRRSGRTTRA